MGRAIKPIATYYKGYRFRSRLEARWAVFFDAAGIEWCYEEQGWDLSGVMTTAGTGHPEDPTYLRQRLLSAPVLYLPDFYLPKQECWVEIKAWVPTDPEMAKMERLVYATERDGFVFWGGIPMPVGETNQDIATQYFNEDDSAWAFKMSEGRVLDYEHSHKWCECPRCGLLGITFGGFVEELPCACFDYDPGWHIGLPSAPVPRVFNAASPRLVEAYKAARGARFEHQEQPTTITAPLGEALKQERLRAEVLADKLARIRELLDLDDPHK
jgi:hypothetical protein